MKPLLGPDVLDAWERCPCEQAGGTQCHRCRVIGNLISHAIRNAVRPGTN